MRHVLYTCGNWRSVVTWLYDGGYPCIIFFHVVLRIDTIHRVYYHNNHWTCGQRKRIKYKNALDRKKYTTTVLNDP